MSNQTGGHGLSLADGVQPFRGRGWKTQVAVVASGVLVWAAAYAVLLTALGGEALASADSLEAIHARRNAAAVAGLLTGGYFAGLWTRAHGGPLLNILYLIGVQVLMPARAYALGGTPPEHPISQAGTALGLHLANPAWVWDHAIAVLPSVVAFCLVLAYWAKSLNPEEEEAFAKNHLPEAWLRLRQTE